MKKGMTGSGYILVGLILGLLIVVPIIIYATNAFSGETPETKNSINSVLNKISEDKSATRWTVEIGKDEFVIIFNKDKQFFGQAFIAHSFDVSNLFAIDYYANRYSEVAPRVAIVENPCYGIEHCFCKFKLGEVEKNANLKPYTKSEFPELSNFDESVMPSLFKLDKVGECTNIEQTPALRYVISEYNTHLGRNVQIVNFGGVVLAPGKVYKYEVKDRGTGNVRIPVETITEVESQENVYNYNYFIKPIIVDEKMQFIACKLEEQCQ